MNDVQSLSHSKWRCNYHIVFAPKYRRQVIYRELKQSVGKILRDSFVYFNGNCSPIILLQGRLLL